MVGAFIISGITPTKKQSSHHCGCPVFEYQELTHLRGG
jgi:hypothetical protein